MIYSVRESKKPTDINVVLFFIHVVLGHKNTDPSHGKNSMENKLKSENYHEKKENSYKI